MKFKKVLLTCHQSCTDGYFDMKLNHNSGKMTRIVGTKRPQEIITTTSWRDGQANVKRVLNVKKAKTSDKKTTKTDKIRADKTTAHTDKGRLRVNICFTWIKVNFF